MLNYEECKKIAQERGLNCGAELDKAYALGDDFVFDCTSGEFIGLIPFVVDVKDGACYGLWPYLCRTNKTMDDMQEVEF